MIFSAVSCSWTRLLNLAQESLKTVFCVLNLPVSLGMKVRRTGRGRKYAACPVGSSFSLDTLQQMRGEHVYGAKKVRDLQIFNICNIISQTFEGAEFDGGN